MNITPVPTQIKRAHRDDMALKPVAEIERLIHGGVQEDPLRLRIRSAPRLEVL